jgi:hypothetical protein
MLLKNCIRQVSPCPEQGIAIRVSILHADAPFTLR